MISVFKRNHRSRFWRNQEIIIVIILIAVVLLQLVIMVIIIVITVIQTVPLQKREARRGPGLPVAIGS